MEEGKWYFDIDDKTVSTMQEGIELEVCVVSCFDKFGEYKYVFGEKSKGHAALLTSAPALLEALEEFTEMYCQMINSGDCGNWDPESDKEVIRARAAIAASRGDL